MWHPFIDSWNLLKIERVQKWTGKNSTVQDWTQRTVYVFYETVISYVLLKNERK